MVGLLEVINVDEGSNGRIYSPGCALSVTFSDIPAASGRRGSYFGTVLKSCYPYEDKRHIDQDMSKKSPKRMSVPIVREAQKLELRCDDLAMSSEGEAYLFKRVL